MVPETFKCLTCEMEVVYTRIVIPALRREVPRREEPQVVYLTCRKNHTHPYTING